LALLRERPDAHAPTLRRVLDDLSEDDLRLDFEFGLDTLLAGLTTIARDGAPTSESA
jgi:hypothetical protein